MNIERMNSLIEMLGRFEEISEESATEHKIPDEYHFYIKNGENFVLWDLHTWEDPVLKVNIEGEDLDEKCGTAGCIAGTAKILGLPGFEDLDFNTSKEFIINSLAQKLDIPYSLSNKLFARGLYYSPQEKIDQIKDYIFSYPGIKYECDAL